MSSLARLSALQRSRFWSHVQIADDCCWVWTGAVSGSGYGRLNARGVTVYAHRVALEMSGVTVPDELDVDHRCHNRLCVRPDHLRLATRGQNNQNFGRAHSHGRSGVRGVSWHSASSRWRVSVVLERHQYHGGFFASLADAEEAAIALRNELYTHNEMDRTERKSA